MIINDLLRDDEDGQGGGPSAVAAVAKKAKGKKYNLNLMTPLESLEAGKPVHVGAFGKAKVTIATSSDVDVTDVAVRRRILQAALDQQTDAA